MDGVPRRGTLVAGGATLADEAGNVSLDRKQTTLDALSCAKALYPLMIGRRRHQPVPAARTPYDDSYRGPITPASSAVAADDTLVDMFASVATGNATPEAAVKQASREAAR